MAEHLNQEKPEAPSGLDLIGTTLEPWRLQRAYEHAQSIGLSPSDALSCVNGMAAQYARDKPYEAQGHAMKYVDLTGHYRLMAALLA